MNFSLDFLDKNLFLAFIFYFRIYDEVSSDIKKRRTSRSRKNDDTKLVGPAVFPVGLLKSEDRNISSQHPWACSLRTRGFRGRHRCGVTLLSGQYTTLQSTAEYLVFSLYNDDKNKILPGPTVNSPEDPFVLVGAAHCNHICKDRHTGHVLETCCCRPPNVPGSCAKGSFLTQQKCKITNRYFAGGKGQGKSFLHRDPHQHPGRA